MAKPEQAKQGILARRAALEALLPVLGGGDMFIVAEDMPPAEVARARRLALTSLRHLGRIDSLLGRYLQRKPELELHIILRLGAAELLVDQAAPHGVVDSYVTLAKQIPETRRASGLVNAVLRKITREGAEIWGKQKPQSMPAWLRKPLIAAHGKAVAQAIEAAHEAGAPIDLTACKAVEGALALPTGSYRMPQGTQVSAIPGYEEGAFWVQDAAAALPARLLGDVAGLEVLDLCAAPGGKTMQLAAAGAKVTALDSDQDRLARLQENLARTGLAANVVCADAKDWRGGPFDAILLDAPCSATGTIRRHPELPFIRDASNLDALAHLQSRLIDAALAQLKPGGRLVYCTCSLLPAEGEDQVTAALGRHTGLKVLPVDPVGLGGEASWLSAEGGLRLRPDFWADKGGMDGFYMALFQGR